MVAWKRPVLLVGGLFFIVVCAVVIVLVSTVLGIALLGVGTLVGLLWLSSMQRRSTGRPIPAAVVVGITLFLLGTVIAAVAGFSGDIVSAVVGVVLVVLGIVLAARGGVNMQRQPRAPQPQTQPYPPAPQAQPVSAPPSPSPYPPGVEFGAPPAPPAPATSPPVVPPPLPSAERFCPSCGSGSARAAAFCRSCGTPLPPPP